MTFLIQGHNYREQIVSGQAHTPKVINNLGCMGLATNNLQYCDHIQLHK